MWAIFYAVVGFCAAVAIRIGWDKGEQLQQIKLSNFAGRRNDNATDNG